jgi:hypothetical protein
MNLSDVAEEVAARLDTIDGLRCFAYQPPSIVPPAGIVLNPAPGDIEYDQTYGRGMDRMTLPVIVVVGRSAERSAQEDIRAYCDGSGTRSVKAVLESGTYTAFDHVRVATAGVDGVAIAGTEYLAALFDLDIVGQGS